MAVFEYDENQHFIFLTQDGDIVNISHSFFEEDFLPSLEGIVESIKAGTEVE